MKIKVNIHEPKEKFIRSQYCEEQYTVLSESDLTFPVKRNKLKSKCDNYNLAESKHILYILKEATNEIITYIEWDRHTEHNHTEICGFMIGHHYYDESQDIYFSEVESIITVPPDMSTEVYLQLSTDSMFEIDQLLDTYNSEHESDCVFVGWFHTHPNSLPVFMSSTDLLTQSRFFADDLGYAIVLNPHKLLWKAFRSINCYDVKCLMVNKSVLVENNENERILSQTDEKVLNS